MGMVFWITLCKRFREIAVWFAIEHFYLRKLRNKARRESRLATCVGGRATACARYGEVSGKLKQACLFYFQLKKMPYRVDYGNSRRRQASSTRWTSPFRKSHLPIIHHKSRQNSPEGLVYGNSNATTAFANSRLVVPALWTLTAHILHGAFVTIFTSNAITKDSEQGFD